MSSAAPTLLELLDGWTQKTPDKTALSFLDDSAEIVRGCSLSYSDISTRSSHLAAHLTSGQNALTVGDRYGTNTTELQSSTLHNYGMSAVHKLLSFIMKCLKFCKLFRVLLVYPPSLDFIVAFLGCLKAGLIAVPTFPPDPRRLNKDLKMFANIADSCKATAALTSAAYNYATKLGSLQNAFSITVKGDQCKWPELQWIVTDNLFATPPITSINDFKKLPQQCDIAFLQYTSGSTSDPKGVIITQKNLSDNLRLIITGLNASEDTVVVSWLPQYHDMGLIGSYLGALYCGGCGYYLSPVNFIRNPSLWISAMSKYKATHIQAPNFAYALTARKYLAQAKARLSKKIAEALDLSSVRHMINAGVTVREQ